MIIIVKQYPPPPTPFSFKCAFDSIFLHQYFCPCHMEVPYPLVLFPYFQNQLTININKGCIE